MTQIIDVPGMGEVEFPDDMSDEQITAAIKSSMEPAPPRAFGAELLRQAKLTGRDAVSAVAALPGMAMDAGVGLRNLTEGAVNRYAPNMAEGIYSANRKLAGNSDLLASILPGGASAQRNELGLSDLITGEKASHGFTPYSMPSQDFQSALTQSGVPEPESGTEKGMSFIRQAMLGSRIPAPQAANQAPKDFVNPQQALRNQVLKKAQGEGYVVPPSAGNPTAGNRLLEGIAGKVKLSQEAAMRNQPVTEKLAARALGQNPDAPLTQGALNVIRKEAHDAGYLPVKAIGEIATDSRFLDDLAGITKTSQGASQSFPGLKPPSEIEDVVTTLKQEKFDASDGVDAISYLRELADDAYNTGNKQLGKAYKSASNAIENMIERDLAKRGEDAAGVLKGYRDARKLIAQTYTAGKGIVDEAGGTAAGKYAAELLKGKPLTGDQKTIGQFASTFGKYNFTPKQIGDVYPSISPLDAYGSAIAAGAADSVAPLALPLTRVGLREYLLSPSGQARALRAPYIPPETLGLLGAGVTTQDDLLGLLGQ
jgi:hypothetical protein